MNQSDDPVVAGIVNEFHLASRLREDDLEARARYWGVTSIEEQEIGSDAMLLSNKDSFVAFRGIPLPLEDSVTMLSPDKGGYSIILKKSERLGLSVRQRFSLAHELGHLLLQKYQALRPPRSANAQREYRGHGHSDDEERLCDKIAAEILMPLLAFQEDGWMEGWSVRNVRLLASKYNTSVPATAMRMIDLMPDEALMGVWKVSGNDGESAKLQWAHAGKTAYRVPSGSISSKRLALVTKAWNSGRVESGAAPVQDSRFEKIRLLDVPAEAMAWGRGEYKQVLVYYYPGRIQEYNVG